MIRAALFLMILGMASAQEKAIPFVVQVQKAATAGDFAAANRLLDLYKSVHGVNPEYVEALSWIGRGQLKAGHLAAASANALLVRNLCTAQQAHIRLDSEPHLPIALGAAIEVEANVMAQQNERDQAVALLRAELTRLDRTSIRNRLQKDLNLLTLEGKPAPELDVAHWIGSVKPRPLAAHRGHPVLLFLWAHWCPDCKQEVGIVETLLSTYGPRGFVVVAPTQHYGYVAGGQDAAPAVEANYISQIFTTYYVPLSKAEVPLSEENFKRYGVSTTPTLVLIDAAGIVRLYHPGAAPLDELAHRIENVMRPFSRSGV